MTSTRERKERFIKSFGPGAARQAVLSLFGRYGIDMLSDELMDEITSEIVGDARATNRRNITNRRIYAETQARSAS